MLIIDTTEQDFQKDVLDSELPVLLQLKTAWWDACIDFVPTFEELAQKFGDQIKFVRVDLDEFSVHSDVFKKVINIQEVLFTPVLFYFRKGKAVAQFNQMYQFVKGFNLAGMTDNLPYTTEAISKFIERRLKQASFLETLSTYELPALTHSNEGLNNSNSVIESSAKDFKKDVIEGNLPTLLLSYWGHGPVDELTNKCGIVELSNKYINSFARFAEYYRGKIKFVQLDRGEGTKEMQVLAAEHDINLSREGDYRGVMFYPVLYRYKNGYKVGSSHEEEEYRWSFMQRKIDDDMPVDEIILGNIYHLLNQ